MRCVIAIMINVNNFFVRSKRYSNDASSFCFSMLSVVPVIFVGIGGLFSILFDI